MWCFIRFVREDRGAEFVEWALVAALFAIAGSAGFSSLSGTIGGTLATVGERVTIASAATTGTGAGPGSVGAGAASSLSLAAAVPAAPPNSPLAARGGGGLPTPGGGSGGRPVAASNTNQLAGLTAQAAITTGEISAEVGRGDGRAQPPGDGRGLGGVVADTITGVVGFVVDAATTPNETGQGGPVPTSGSLGSRLGGAVGSALSSAGSTFNRVVKAQSDVQDKAEKTSDAITRNLKG